MADPIAARTEPLAFETHPTQYKHWKLDIAGDKARLVMSVREDAPLRPGYTLKLNSYDLGVDIELADAVERLRFEHPEVRAVTITSDRDRVFCAGANILMLASSSHPFKVNFCKFTNETRLAIEDASRHSGQRYLAACTGTTAGGGYELALACDEILLVDDGNSAVSLPEVPLLGVLPGTGGLTRVVDKRKVRRDHADIFSTLSEGIKGKRAVEWKLVDAVAPKSQFDKLTGDHAQKLAAGSPARAQHGIQLQSVRPYRYVTLGVDSAARTATLTLAGPKQPQPENADDIIKAGSDFWPLRAFRELDDALLDLRFNHEEVGLILLKTTGDASAVLAVDRTLERHKNHWLVHEIRLKMARVLRRLDLTGRSLFAVVLPGSCFAGSLLELALAADRVYLLDDATRPVQLATSELNAGAFPMSNGLTRHAARNLVPAPAHKLLDATAADAAGLVTVRADELDFDDTLRVAIEERVSLSPDALTGMEASLRFTGPETMETKIFGRLSAWQNWIFTRANATGERGALTLYGKPERPGFDWRRT
jgi:benzoyl-CoA-dihydrodiol lyase